MKRMQLTTFLALLALPAYATEEKAAPAVMSNVARVVGIPNNCTMQENVSLNVNFTIHANSFADARARFDEKNKQLEDFAKQQHIEKFNLQSMNYSVNPQTTYNNGAPEVTGYQLSGNANYQLDSADNAFKLGEFLTQQKFQVSVNVNKYRNGMCNRMIQE